MDAREFGQLVGQARRRGGYSKSELARQLGRLPDSGRVFDAAGITRIERGGPVRVDRELVDRLIEVLDLDPFEAYEAADLRPEGFTAEDHRTFAAVGGRTRADQQKAVTGWLPVSAAHAASAQVVDLAAWRARRTALPGRKRDDLATAQTG